MTHWPRSVTAALMGDPEPRRLERAEALRLCLPEPRELPLSEWLGEMDLSRASAGSPPSETHGRTTQRSVDPPGALAPSAGS